MYKKLIFMLLLAFIPLTTVFGQGATGYNVYQKPNSNWWTGGSRDTGWHWMQDIDALVAGGLGGSGGDIPGTGNIFYVDSNVSNEGDGSSWTNAKDTLDEAIALCTDNNNDVIYVASGHAEDWDSTDSVDVDVVGVTIIGLGTGTDMPTFTFDDTDGELVLGAANCTIRNLAFLPSVAQVVHAIEIEADADGSVIDHCWFMDGETAATDEFKDAIQWTAASDNITVINCIFESYSSVATNQANSACDLTAGVVKDTKIIGNYFYGDYDDACIFSDDADLRNYIANNFCLNTQTGDLAIEFTGNATGTVFNNILKTDGGTTAIDPGYMECIGNSYGDYGANVDWDSGVAALFMKAGADAYPANVEDLSVLGMIMAIDGDVSAYDEATMSLEALGTDTDSIISTLSGLSAVGNSSICSTNAVNTTVIAAGLAGFGNDAFNEGWSLICTYDTGGAVGTAPSGEIRDITDYVSSTGTFTTAAWTAALTAGDYVMLIPTHDVPKDYGRVIYCDDGGSNGEGTSWQTAKTTLAAAEAIAAAGDIILVGENHNENLSTGGDTINVAGVTVIGMGSGNSRPLFDMDADSDELTLDAAGITLRNLRFRPGANTLTSGIRVEDEALGATIEDCAFIDGEAAGTDEWTDCISVDTSATGLTIKNCTFVSSGAPGTFINLDEATIADARIEGCYFYGSCSEAPIWGAAAVPTNIQIINNIVCNGSAGQCAIEFQGNATGVIAGNFCYTNDFATMLDPGTAYCFNNWGTDAADEAAVQIPVSSDTSDITEDDDGSNSERLEYLQNKVEDILAGIKMAGGSVGDVYYVDDGGSGGAATTWATAETTLDAAVADCTANVGDIIFVAPAHSESLGDGQVTVDVAGITIIGLGEGAETSEIVFNHANSSIDITADGCTVKNLALYSTTAATAIGVDVDAGDTRLEDLRFTDTGNFEFAICIDLGATAENAVVKNCELLSTTGTTGATSGIAITGGVIDRLVIEDCTIIGDFDNAGIYSDQINTNAVIKNNIITNKETTDHAIELSAATTGSLIDNLLYADTYGSVLDPGAMYCFGNKQCVGTDTGAEDVPLVAGQTYARAMLTGDLNASDNLFSVTGSPIIVKSFIGKCTTECGGATTLKIFCDADDTYDYDCSTSVDVDTVDAGGNLVFTAVVNESVLTVQTLGSSGSMGTDIQWWVEEGMLESTVDAGGSTGDIEWYMIFTPVESGCEVIPQ